MLICVMLVGDMLKANSPVQLGGESVRLGRRLDPVGIRGAEHSFESAASRSLLLSLQPRAPSARAVSIPRGVVARRATPPRWRSFIHLPAVGAANKL